MGKTIRIWLFLSLIALVSAFAQTSETQNQPAPAASQEDIRRLENQLSSTRRQMIEALQSAANQSAEQKKEISNRYETIIGSLSAELQRSERQASEREARLNEDRLRQERNFRHLIGGVIISFVVIGFLVLFFFRKNRAQVVVVSSTVKEGEEIPDVLVDPELGDITRALERKKEQQFVLYLKDADNRVIHHFNCVARPPRNPGADPVVSIEGDPNPEAVTWKKRRNRAASLIGSHSSRTA